MSKCHHSKNKKIIFKKHILDDVVFTLYVYWPPRGGPLLFALLSLRKWLSQKTCQSELWCLMTVWSRPYQGHRCGVEQLALWGSQISLELNTLKTVAVTVELRSPSPLCLLATIFQDLKWSLRIDTIIKEAEQSLRQLRRFNLPQEVMIYSTLE